MARLLDSGPALIVSREDEKREIISWYRAQLARTAPPQGLRWEPIKIGPTWQWSAKSGWLLPEFTLGWGLLAWAGMWLKGNAGPWLYTMEQARFLLHYYAIDPETGEFLNHSGALQRLKGWGKDPIAATLVPTEMVGPVRFEKIAGGEVVGREEPNAWVQVVAVSQEQTKNTMKLLPSLIPAETREHYGFQIGKLGAWALGDTRQAEAVTASPLALEGGRPTLVVRNETQNWNSSNGGHEMDGVLEGNAAKRDIDSPARMLDIFNAYRPGEDSVAERVREAWELAQGARPGSDEDAKPRYMELGLMYDSLEAPPEAPLNADAASDVVKAVRGDAVWLDAEGRILKSILNPKNPPSESRRKWYNQITAAEDAFTTPQTWDGHADTELMLEPGEEIALFADCSKSDDATGIVACRISDGVVFPLGMWQRPPGERGKGWLAPREKFDAVISSAIEGFRVVAYFADPSHALEDETMTRYWDGLLDEHHRQFQRSLKLWAKPGKARGHSVMFDMSDSANHRMFVDAVGQFEADLDAGLIKHNGDARLRNHMLNAVRYPTRHGMSVAKEHRESRKKIDLAVCAIGARMVRRMYLNQAARGKGKVW